MSRSLCRPNDRRRRRASHDVPVSRHVPVTRHEACHGKPSIRRWVTAEHGAIAATMLVRTGEDWIGRVVTGAIDPNLPETGIPVPLAEPYAGLDLTGAAAGGRPGCRSGTRQDRNPGFVRLSVARPNVKPSGL